MKRVKTIIKYDRQILVEYEKSYYLFNNEPTPKS